MKKTLLGLAVLALVLGAACKTIQSAKGQPTDQDMANNETVNVAEDSGNSGQSTNSNRINTVASTNGSTGGNSNVYESANTKDSSQNSDVAPVSTIESVNGSTGANANLFTDRTGSATSNVDYAQMYTDLGMTDDQIRNFKMKMEKFQNVQDNSANGEMMGTLSAERDRQLENILTPEQFEKYQDWKENN